MASKLTRKKPATENPEATELGRVISLPMKRTPNEEDVEIDSFERVVAEKFEIGERLLPQQVDGLWQFETCRGAFLAVGVGFGKSGISLMAAQIAANRGWARRTLLLIPPHLVSGLINRHIPEWRKRVNLSLTFHVIAGKNRAARAKLCASGAPGVYVMPYSLLSQEDAISMLTAIDADCVIADEAHKLKNPRSACTKRLLAVMHERHDRAEKGTATPPIFVAMSGSFTKSSIMEYHHLIDLALGSGSPLPRRASQAFTWGLVVDSSAGPTPGLVAGAMGRLITWAHDHFPAERQLFQSRIGVDNARNAYRRRLVCTPGVVATGDERPSASLALINREVPGHGAKLLALIERVRDEFETPEGEPIDHAIHTYKWERELSSGFYNSLVWPTVAEHAKNRRITEREAEDRIGRAMTHLKALQTYHGALREFLKEAPLGLDTPMDVARAISRGAGDIDEQLVMLWHAVKEADFPGRPDRLSIPVRVDRFKIEASLDWAAEFGTGLMWVFHQEMGEWLMEELKAAGADPVYAPAGADELIENIGDPGRGGKGDRLVVASISAHGVGRNLQSFKNQLFVEWPRSATLAEQTLGRVHRTGQTADEVIVHTLIGTEWDEINRAATLADAIYVTQTMGTAQRVLYADYDPQPRIYDPKHLRARGAAPLSTDPALWAKIRSMFSQ